MVASSGDCPVTFTASGSFRSEPACGFRSGWSHASIAYTSLGPGSIVSISGQNLAQTTVVAGDTSLPTLLQTTRVVLATADTAM